MTTELKTFRFDSDVLQKFRDISVRRGDLSWHVNEAMRLYELIQNKPKVVVETKKEVSAPKTAFDPKMILAEGINGGAWGEWCDYRKTKRKPVSEMATKKQFKLLREYDFDTQREIIDLSIANDYAGLFPPKSKVSGGVKNDAINSTDWANGLSDLASQPNHGGVDSEFSRVEEFGGGQRDRLSEQLQAPAIGGNDRGQHQLGLDGQSWHGKG